MLICLHNCTCMLFYTFISIIETFVALKIPKNRVYNISSIKLYSFKFQISPYILKQFK